MIYVNQIFSLSQVTSANYELLQCSSFTTEQCGWVPRNRCRNEKKDMKIPCFHGSFPYVLIGE